MMDPSMLGPGPGGPPPSINLGGGGPPGAGEGPENPGENAAAQKAIDALQAWLSSEQDAQDKALIAQLLQKAHQLQANEAKEKDAAVGVSPALRFVRRQQQRLGR